MAPISLQAPLLFIDGPPMVTVVQVEREESTSVYNMPETEQEQVETESEKIPAGLLDETDVVKKIRYLAEPFPRSAYRPLQFLVNGQLLTGGIVGISDKEIALEVSEESQAMDEIRTLELHTIEEVFWKGQPFS